MHGGVDVTSEEGVGSTFRLWVPLVECEDMPEDHLHSLSVIRHMSTLLAILPLPPLLDESIRCIAASYDVPVAGALRWGCVVVRVSCSVH